MVTKNKITGGLRNLVLGATLLGLAACATQYKSNMVNSKSQKIEAIKPIDNQYKKIIAQGQTYNTSDGETITYVRDDIRHRIIIASNPDGYIEFVDNRFDGLLDMVNKIDLKGHNTYSFDRFEEVRRGSSSKMWLDDPSEFERATAEFWQKQYDPRYTEAMKHQIEGMIDMVKGRQNSDK